MSKRKKPDNRFMRIPLSAKMLVNLFTVGPHEGYKVIEGLPEDAEIRNATISFDTKKVVLLIYSKKFKNVKPGEQVPEIAITAMEIPCKKI